MATKKNAKKSEMMHDHDMHDHGMMGHGHHRGMGIIKIVLGVFFLYLAYMQNMQLTGVLILLGVAVWLLTSGFGKLGYGWGMGCGCGCGCGCCGGCNCEWDGKN
ncbi:MAG: hypothetical protein KGH71_02120 [Candidatus Micrarchaeota archaeon]|nr:hypothetical protein [Candidatus Micrarchaeota archaeon]